MTSKNVVFLFEDIDHSDEWNTDHCKEIKLEKDKLVNGNLSIPISELNMSLSVMSRQGIYRSLWHVRQIVIDGEVIWDRHIKPTETFHF